VEEMRVYIIPWKDINKITGAMDGVRGIWWETDTQLIIEFPRQSVIYRSEIDKKEIGNAQQLQIFKDTRLGRFQKVIEGR
jgi:hypothetical protein